MSQTSAEREPVPEGMYDVADAIDRAQWSAFQKRMLAFLALVFAVDGMANQSLGIALPALIADWGAAREQFASVTAANLIGVAIGTVIGGLLGDRFGRRIALICALFLFGGMTAASAFVQGVDQLLVLRFFDGLGIGAAIPNGTAMISEFTPGYRRGRAIAIGMVFIPIGGIVAGGIAAVSMQSLGWQALFLTAGVLPILLSTYFIFALPESPTFLLRSGRERELTGLLARMGLDSGGQPFFRRNEGKRAATPLRILLAPDVRFDTIMLWLAFFTCLMASYTLFSWVPTMLHSLGFGLAATSSGLLIFHVGGVLGALSGGFLLDKIGFRSTHVAFAGGAAVMAVVLAAVLGGGLQSALVVLPLMMLLGFGIAGVHNTIYTLAANIYPTAARASGVGFAAAIGRIGSVLSSYTGVLSLQMGGSIGFFGVVAALLLVCCLAGIRSREIGRVERPTDKPAPLASA